MSARDRMDFDEKTIADLRDRNAKLVAALRAADEFIRLTKPGDNVRWVIREALQQSTEKP